MFVSFRVLVLFVGTYLFSVSKLILQPKYSEWRLVLVIIILYLFEYFCFCAMTSRPLGRPRRRWEDNIRMDLEEIAINAGNWVDSLRMGVIGEPL